MKRKTVYTISLIWAILALVLFLSYIAMYAMESDPQYLFMMFFSLVAGIILLIGAIGFKNKKPYGKILLIIGGILTLPIGLIITYLATKDKELE